MTATTAQHRRLGPLAGCLLILGLGGGSASAAGGAPGANGATVTLVRHHLASARAAAAAAGGADVTGSSAESRVTPGSSSTLATRRTTSAAPDPVAVVRFAGLQASDVGATAPVFSIAVDSHYVVQTASHAIRISTRTGTSVMTLPAWSLFGVGAEEVPGDVDVAWDAAHARWLATTTTTSSFDTHALWLAVSDSADPTAGWTTYAAGDAEQEASRSPVIASSGDKVVIGHDVESVGGGLLHGALLTIPWSRLLTSSATSASRCALSDWVHPVPARVTSAATDVHVLLEDATTGGVGYARVVGSGLCPSQIVDVTTLPAYAPLASPPAPRQPPADTIANGVDERITSAVWQAGRLSWASTVPWSYDGGATHRDAVMVGSVITQASGPPSAGDPFAVAPGDAIDAFSPSVGMTRDGTLVVVASTSSVTDPPAFAAMRWTATDGVGGLVPVDVSQGPIVGDAWARHGAIATDPLGSGSVWATHELVDGGGQWRSTVARLLIDADPPSRPGTPSARLSVPSTLDRTILVRYAWTPATDNGSGMVTYGLRRAVDGVDQDDGLTTATAVARRLIDRHTYTESVQAIDPVGNASPIATGPAVTPWTYQQTSSTTYAGTWGTATGTSFSGSSVRWAKAAGSSATFTAIHARSIAIVTTRSSSRGSFRVYVDGVYKRTVSAYSSIARFRQLVYEYGWASPGTHKVTIVVVGTIGHPRVDVDAFVVLK